MTTVAAGRWRGLTGRRPPLLFVALGTIAAILALIPVLFVVGYAISIEPSRAWELLWRPRVAELLGNTTRLVIAATAATAAIGLGAAWLVERTTIPGRKVFAVLLAAPLAVPAFVNGFAWVSLTPAVEGFAGAVWVTSLSYYPFVYLPVAASIRGLDRTQEDVARALGRGPLQTFTGVVLPQIKPALFGGMLLVALHLLAEFGAFQMVRFETFTTAIYAEYESSFDGPAANMLASVLLAGCLVLLVIEIRTRGRARLSRVGGGVDRPVPLVALGRWTPAATAGLAGLLLAAVGVPAASLGYWVGNGPSTSFAVSELVSVTWNSVRLGLFGAIAATMLALPIAFLAQRHRGRFTTMVERATYVPRALPGIIVALSLVLVTVRLARPLYQTTALLVTAYVIMFLPLAIVSVRAALSRASPALEEVARSLGAGPTAAVWRVTIPLIAPGLGAGAALVFLQILTELTATLLLAPTGVRTLATQFWSYTGTLSYGAAAPYAITMVLLSVPATYLLARRFAAT